MSDSLRVFLCEQTTNKQRGKGRNIVSVFQLFLLVKSFSTCDSKLSNLATSWSYFFQSVKRLGKLYLKNVSKQTCDEPTWIASYPKLNLLWNGKLINLGVNHLGFIFFQFHLQSLSVKKRNRTVKYVTGNEQSKFLNYGVNYQFCTLKWFFMCHCRGCCETGRDSFALWVGCYLPLKVCQNFKM